MERKQEKEQRHSEYQLMDIPKLASTMSVCAETQAPMTFTRSPDVPVHRRRSFGGMLRNTTTDAATDTKARGASTARRSVSLLFADATFAEKEAQ